MPVFQGSNTGSGASNPSNQRNQAAATPQQSRKLNWFQRNWKTMLLGASLAYNFVQHKQNEILQDELTIASFRMNAENLNLLKEKGAYAQIIKISKDDPGEVNIYVPKNDGSGSNETIIRQVPVRRP